SRESLYSVFFLFYFFFFQAEDGIRDFHVTGVQTCALPISLLIALHPFASSGKALRALSGLDALAERDGFLIAYPDSADLYWDDEIGRASCRERVEGSVVGARV